ncbi:MAG TPA: cyclic nucleotide-binding domain-containing protein [Acidimicrobiia bacterium]|nr:cyclic nucleotide-binding domain-containing protein [Acidimicrobiia bacterium]
MRIESSVLSLSWIPSEAVTGLPRQVFEVGVTHYDEPPPDVIADDDELEQLRVAGRFRFANRLAAWIEVRDGAVVDAGYCGGGRMGLTTVSVARRSARFEPVALPDIQRAPQIRGTEARFVQTTGGRAPIPAPRRVKHPPYFRLKPPDVWTTLALTIRADGTSDFEIVGASKFPRHWVFDAEGKLAAKAGLTDFKDWYRSSAGLHTPWGDEDSEALVTAVETALERQLSATIMQGGQKPEIRTIKQGRNLVEQGQPGDDLFLLLDGVLQVIVDGEPVAEVGPGAIVGELAILEGGTRTGTLHALTKIRVAVARADQVDRAALVELSKGHRRDKS